MTNINNSFDELKKYYDDILNKDKSTYNSSNDEPTPIDCIIEMTEKIPDILWNSNTKIYDPCCGNGNFHFIMLHKLLENGIDIKHILENQLYFNDINNDRLNNVKNIYLQNKYKLNITHEDYLKQKCNIKYNLIVANPPYAKLLENGQRASKNHNLIKDFIDKSLDNLKDNGYLMFITPDNWMSYADRNVLIEKITKLQIIHLDIHSAKKYFKKIGSSFTWYIIQKKESYKNINISGIWKNINYTSNVPSIIRKYIPLLYTNEVYNILQKTIDNNNINKFNVETSSDLHKFTKKILINDNETNIYKYKLIHTPKQIVYASRPHKYQDGYKVFISTTDKYKVFIDNCGMTQSIAFIRCNSKEEAEKYRKILEHPLYIFLNNICRYGNFNNIRILQNFPKPYIINDNINIYNIFDINDIEKNFIEKNI
jgi:adenine-specific DNA-methyltransferase